MNPASQAIIRQHGERAGCLTVEAGGAWSFAYAEGYQGPPVSLALPVRAEPYGFAEFPPFLEGLLPEGPQLEALLRKHKIDRDDCFRQLVTVGRDMVGSLTAEEWAADHEGGRK